MANKPAAQRFILLPPRGMTTASVIGNTHVGDFMRSLSVPASAATGISQSKMRVIDSTHENGIKLVELTPQGISELRLEAPGVRIVPELFYDIARAPIPYLAAKPPPKPAPRPPLPY